MRRLFCIVSLALVTACGASQASSQASQAATTVVIQGGAGNSPSIVHGKGGSGGDRDGDGIADSRDLCPDEPEDFDGFEDTDGCPDPDNDKDGVLDVNDRCPNAPGPRGDGCPRSVGTDRDHDGIPDAMDKCPDDPEDKDGFQDDDGCPDPDNDMDGIPDVRDKCPNEPETFNGYQDDDGCPDKKP